MSLAFGLAILLLSSEAGPEHVFTIIVGNNQSPVEDPELAPLRYADDDAARYYQLFERSGAEQRLLSVLDADTQRRHPNLARVAEAPTVANLDRALAEFRALAQSGDWVLYLIFSGHGADNDAGAPYLAFADQGLTRAMLFERLHALPAQWVHLIIDACNAGAVVDARGPFDRELEAKPVEPPLMGPQALTGLPKVGAIVATSAGQESHEWSRYESGVFTHELLSALLGGADVNGDRRIEYSEVQAFVAAANSTVQDPRARPSIQAIAPALDQRRPLLTLSQGPYLTGQADRHLGHFFIELDNGQRYADAHFSPQTPFAIALPPSVRGYLRTEEEEAALPALNEGVVELSELQFSARSMRARGATDAEYRRALFAAPFDETYYRGYVDSRGLVGVPFSGARLNLDGDQWRTQDQVAVGLWVGAGATLVATAITAGLAASTRSEFERATAQAEARTLASRYDGLQAATWGAAALTAALAIAGATLWIEW